MIGNMKSQHQASAAKEHPLWALTGGDSEHNSEWLARVRQFAEPLLLGHRLDSGELIMDHAQGMSSVLKQLGASVSLQAGPYLCYASEQLSSPEEVIEKAFGAEFASLVSEANRLTRLQRQAGKADAGHNGSGQQSQIENIRRMLLAFSRDLRVVLLRLTSRLQTLRHYAQIRQVPPAEVTRESLQVFAPLANRLGIWQIKWEMEDLAFRFLEPETYRKIANSLDEKRTEREQYMQQLRESFTKGLREHGIAADVQGRPKHIYSIAKKMQGKSLGFDQIFDIRALRVIVKSVPDCYAVLGWVHSNFQPVTDEFDDYIARPKQNGYQSLHTVVRDRQGRAIEVQIRSQEMHDHAEHGVAAHWAYKEAGAKGYAGVSAGGEYDAKIAVLRQLLAWERDLSQSSADADGKSGATSGALDDRIYVLTPDAAIIDLPKGSTAVDFAYSLHTNLGHRCRGARLDGVMVPLNTQLKNGQTVEIISSKEGGPSRDWLNPELGFIASQRARAKVRSWFNAQLTRETMARGREAVEKLLQREGKTSIKLDVLAEQLGFKSADDLFEVVGKDEFSLRHIEMLLHPAVAAQTPDDAVLTKVSRKRESQDKGGVLVVGVDSLLTQLARCCRPAPPDSIKGYVTRGKGVSIHRQDCPSFHALELRNSDRVIEVEWGKPKLQGVLQMYPVDVSVVAIDRQGLLRDISEVFAKEKMNVIGVQTQSVKADAFMTFTVEVPDSSKLQRVLASVAEIAGVRSARRR
jgi:GTP pyrophosphokinase